MHVGSCSAEEASGGSSAAMRILHRRVGLGYATDLLQERGRRRRAALLRCAPMSQSLDLGQGSRDGEGRRGAADQIAADGARRAPRAASVRGCRRCRGR
jgi:hypothetical protein